VSPVRSIVLATRNCGKVREIRQALADVPVELIGLDRFADIPEPPETGETFAQNARDKALYYARATGHWCLADDSGLEVDALGGAPGVLSARYAADRCPPGADRLTIDQANNAKLLEQLADIPVERRTARFVCHLALASEEGIVLETCGAVSGRIIDSPMGTNGFGYDPLFWVEQLGCTTAQLSREQKNQISHRGKALRCLADQLRKMLAARR